MRHLQIDETKARSIYKTASPELKVMLEDTFTKDFFLQRIEDRIKTYEDACAELGIIPIEEYTLVGNHLTEDEIAYRKIKIITKALNEGWKPNWGDSDEKKWFPWFSLSAGFSFYYAYYGCSKAYAGYGSRLCFKSKELTEYAGKQFVELYKKYMC